MTKSYTSQGAGTESDVPSVTDSSLLGGDSDQPGESDLTMTIDADDTRLKFLALCLDQDDFEMVKIINLNLTGLKSDREVFQKIRDTYLHERGNKFFNWVYTRSGYLGQLRWMRLLPPLFFSVVTFKMQPWTTEDGQPYAMAMKSTVEDVPLVLEDSLQADLESNYDYTSPLEKSLPTVAMAAAFRDFRNPLGARPALWTSNFLPKKLHSPLPYHHSQRTLVQGVGLYVPDRITCRGKVILWGFVITVLAFIAIMAV
ncbi:hypothetical protein VFPPC_13189 [Pochonia chlamydosporia 170]|uniref:Uncharacterized protein n=1 Tax=Pochonia chlamydosporia 170 TaxID=1380566 RepID=A0A179F6C5_METCM|nr:hypothetical protein VFPPC_13189 [Pochonia chlamydosporia 170]OAQ60995.1 hypothetical protein VFPPC_13189 [Pochonia chlamydosporia 170]